MRNRGRLRAKLLAAIAGRNRRQSSAERAREGTVARAASPLTSAIGQRLTVDRSRINPKLVS